MVKPRVLFLDIETLPNQSFTWGMYDQNVIRFKEQTCLATYAWKWLGEKEVYARALCDYKGYRAWSYDDARLAADLWKLFDEADIIIAHHGDQFDIKVCQARFIFHKLSPPRPFKTVDTKKAMKRVARFNSNKLDDLSALLENTKKIKTDFDLWMGCIEGNRAAWAQMVKYNKKDILLLERLYLRLRPWIANHPNFSVLSGKLGRVCPKCGSQSLTYHGFLVTQSRRYRRLKCQNCGGWTREVKCEDGAKVTNG
jgi:hypothetical protein